MSSPRKLNKKEIEDFTKTYKIEIKNYHDLIENASVEQELIKNGYTIINRMLVIDKDNTQLNYLKCINKLGQYVYILVDNGYLPYREKDLEYREIDESYMLPLSIKTGILDCVDLQVNGIIFDSDGILCIVKRNSFLNLEEKTYALLGSSQELPNECIPHPLITLSEIKQDANCILEITDTIVKKIRSEFYNKIMSNLDSFSKNIQTLNTIVNEYNKLLTETKSKMENDFIELEEYDRKYTKNPPVLEENKQNHKLVKYNMRKMNEAFIEFVSLNGGLYQENKNVMSIIDKMNDFLQFSKNEFSYLGYVKYEN